MWPVSAAAPPGTAPTGGGARAAGAGWRGRGALARPTPARPRQRCAACGGPPAVGVVLRRAAADTGHTHLLGRFVGGRVAVTAVADGPRSPYVEDFVPGFDEGGHATALGKALLATLTPDQRARYMRDWGMRGFTPATLTTPEALDADLAAGERRGMQIEIGQFRQGVAGAAVVVAADRDLERRLVLSCVLPATEMLTSARIVRSKLLATSRAIADAFTAGDAATA